VISYFLPRVVRTATLTPQKLEQSVNMKLERVKVSHMPIRRQAVSVSAYCVLLLVLTSMEPACCVVRANGPRLSSTAAQLSPSLQKALHTTRCRRRRADGVLDHSCESLTLALARLRGGSSHNGFNPDEWTTPPTRPNPDYVEHYGDDSNAAYPENARRRTSSLKRDNGYPYEDDYDDYGRSPKSTPTESGGSNPAEALLSSILPTVLKQGDKKLGFMLMASGICVSFLGFALFMNKTLLRLGNLLIIVGVPMILGPSRTVSYFVQAEKMRATSCLALGIVLVFLGHPIFGILLEVFGLLNLFGNMFPILMVFVKQMPVIGPLLKGDSSRSSSNSGSRNRERNDDYYDDYGGGRARYRDDASRQQNYYNDDYREDEGRRPFNY
jgi:Got1/Sft2-like family